MYIDPFWGGVGVTLIVELAAVVIISLVAYYEGKDKRNNKHDRKF